MKKKWKDRTVIWRKSEPAMKPLATWIEEKRQKCEKLELFFGKRASEQASKQASKQWNLWPLYREKKRKWEKTELWSGKRASQQWNPLWPANTDGEKKWKLEKLKSWKLKSWKVEMLLELFFGKRGNKTKALAMEKEKKRYKLLLWKENPEAKLVAMVPLATCVLKKWLESSQTLEENLSKEPEGNGTFRTVSWKKKSFKKRKNKKETAT